MSENFDEQNLEEKKNKNYYILVYMVNYILFPGIRN